MERLGGNTTVNALPETCRRPPHSRMCDEARCRFAGGCYRNPSRHAQLYGVVPGIGKIKAAIRRGAGEQAMESLRGSVRRHENNILGRGLRDGVHQLKRTKLEGTGFFAHLAHVAAHWNSTAHWWTGWRERQAEKTHKVLEKSEAAKTKKPFTERDDAIRDHVRQCLEKGPLPATSMNGESVCSTLAPELDMTVSVLERIWSARENRPRRASQPRGSASPCKCCGKPVERARIEQGLSPDICDACVVERI